MGKGPVSVDDRLVSVVSCVPDSTVGSSERPGVVAALDTLLLERVSKEIKGRPDVVGVFQIGRAHV